MKALIGCEGHVGEEGVVERTGRGVSGKCDRGSGTFQNGGVPISVLMIQYRFFSSNSLPPHLTSGIFRINYSAVFLHSNVLNSITNIPWAGDFALKIWGSLRFFIHYMRGVPETHSSETMKPNFAQAFGLSSGRSGYIKQGYDIWNRTSKHDPSRPTRESYNEEIRLAPYTYEGPYTHCPQPIFVYSE